MSDAKPTMHAQRVLAFRGGRARRKRDTLAVEEPLEIRLAGLPLAVIMRTPGHDFDLAAGFLHTEGIVRASADITRMAHCGNGALGGADNIVNVALREPVDLTKKGWQRNFYATSSCGLCGKASIEALNAFAPPLEPDDVRVAARTLYALSGKLRAAQSVFEKTGGLHAAGLFDLDGELIALREDIGRHNAVDKVIGHAFREGRTPLRRCILMVSGRSSFEIMQKTLAARIPIVCAVSAPSSLAVQLARDNRMTLAGFLRGRQMNVYAGHARIVTGE